MSHESFVIVDQGVLDGDPILAVNFLRPEQSWDSGYAVWFVPPEDAPSQDSALMCPHCFLDEHPEAGRGMDLAREHGEALYEGHEWTLRGAHLQPEGHAARRRE